MLILRFNVSSSWEEIEGGLGRELKTHHVLNPLVAD